MKDEKKEEDKGEEEIAAVKVKGEEEIAVKVKGGEEIAVKVTREHTPWHKESCSSSSLSIP